MNSTSLELSKWKKGAAKECYKKLFEPISEHEDQIIYMLRILEKVWTDSDKASEISVAFAIGICEELLNLNNESIQITEETMKDKLKKNQVCFCNFM